MLGVPSLIQTFQTSEALDLPSLLVWAALANSQLNLIRQARSFIIATLPVPHALDLLPPIAQLVLPHTLTCFPMDLARWIALAMSTLLRRPTVSRVRLTPQVWQQPPIFKIISTSAPILVWPTVTPQRQPLHSLPLITHPFL